VRHQACSCATCKSCSVVHGKLFHHVQPACWLARSTTHTQRKQMPCNQILATVQTILCCNCCCDGNECDNLHCPGSCHSAFCKLLRPLSSPLATTLMKHNSNNIADVGYGCCCCMSSVHEDSTCKTHMPVTITQKNKAYWYKPFSAKSVPV